MSCAKLMRTTLVTELGDDVLGVVSGGNTQSPLVNLLALPEMSTPSGPMIEIAPLPPLPDVHDELHLPEDVPTPNHPSLPDMPCQLPLELEPDLPPSVICDLPPEHDLPPSVICDLPPEPPMLMWCGGNLGDNHGPNDGDGRCGTTDSHLSEALWSHHHDDKDYGDDKDHRDDKDHHDDKDHRDERS